jgi:hypothetical protein
MKEIVFVAGLITLFITMFIVGVFAFSGFVFATAWNFVVPLFWHAAPHLSWLHGVAIGFVVGILRGIFTFNQTTKTS